MRKALIGASFFIVLWSADSAFSQNRGTTRVSEEQTDETGAAEVPLPPTGGKYIRKDRTDGGRDLFDAKTGEWVMTGYRNGTIIYSYDGVKYISRVGEKPQRLATPPTSLIMRRDPVTGAERYYRVGPDNKAVEIEFPGDAASNKGEHRHPQASDSAVASGTGFFISTDGYLLTNYHLVKGSRKLVVHTSDSERRAKVVKIDPANDLVLLKIDGSSAAIPLGDARAVAVGDSVMTIGYPNIEVQGTAPKFTKGEVSSLTGFQDDSRLFQISVPIQPGNSGGPLIDERGNVVGITNAQLSALKMITASGSVPQNVNYAVKISYAQLLLDSIPELTPKLLKPHKDKVEAAKIIDDAQTATVLILVWQ
jgi:S1-C subfamily serine protease